MNGKKIYIAGHRGMVGSAIARQLQKWGEIKIVTRTHNELDLTNQDRVRDFFCKETIDEIYLAAAKVGGIYANNTYPADFIYQNMMIEANVIHQAWRAGVKKLLFLGSSCIYPQMAPQPIKEGSLLSGKLESTNEAYAVAKIAGIKLCESYNRQYGTDYRSIMPTNLYGPGDNYHPDNSHVIPAMIRRFHEAKVLGIQIVNVWGTGTPRREFLYVDDMAAASIHIMNIPKETYDSYTTPMQSHINAGAGKDITIFELASLIAKVVDYRGDIRFDSTKPDGTPRKLLDSGILRNTGWHVKVGLSEGLERTYRDFLKLKLFNDH